MTIEEALEELEAGEIEVVRRLVEQEHVGVGSQDRLELRARCLAARAARRFRLLREIGDRESGRLQAQRARVRQLETCEHAEQRRLADPVRPDHADPATGRDGERDTVEHDGIAEGLADRSSFEGTTSARHG